MFFMTMVLTLIASGALWPDRPGWSRLTLAVIENRLNPEEEQPRC
jgi:hypothetical protein